MQFSVAIDKPSRRRTKNGPERKNTLYFCRFPKNFYNCLFAIDNQTPHYSSVRNQGLTATVKDPDAAYAYFGWWLDKPEDNTMPHMVEVFAGGTDMHAADVADFIEGNATYKGPAADKYATKTFTAGAQTDAGVGHFTASTTLTAKFGEADAPGTIGGTVTGFVLDDGTSPAWSVKLEDANLTTNQPLFDGVSEATFGPTAKVPGTWQGSFYNDADATDDTAPGTVAGTFDAVSDNATLIGGFGATKQ